LILEAAVKAGHLPRNPARGVAKFQRNDEEHVDPFTSAELASTLAAAPAEGPTFAAMVRLWAQSGMRAGEVATLRWEDLDTIRGTAVVRRTLSRGRIGPTKTRRVREVSFLHPVAEETPKWRPGVTLASRVVLNELRRLPVQAISGRAGLRPRRRPSLGPDVGASVVAASAPRRRSALPRPGDASAHTVLDAALP
jgi:integrase